MLWDSLARLCERHLHFLPSFSSCSQLVPSLHLFFNSVCSLVFRKEPFKTKELSLSVSLAPVGIHRHSLLAEGCDRLLLLWHHRIVANRAQLGKYRQQGHSVTAHDTEGGRRWQRVRSGRPEQWSQSGEEWEEMRSEIRSVEKPSSWMLDSKCLLATIINSIHLTDSNIVGRTAL